MLDLAVLLVQLIVILGVCRGAGWVFRRFHQPQVIGEMIVGIVLGPSLLGWVAPGIFTTLFPPSSLDTLNALSQVGLLVFMFLAGLELSPGLVRRLGRPAVLVSAWGIVFPFILGTLLAVYLYPRVSAASVPANQFVLFIGVSMSITAFPILARILTDTGMIRSSVGAVAIAAAAADDVSAWIILAGVVLLVRASEASLPLLTIIVGFLAYVLFMFFIGRRCLRKLVEDDGRISQAQLAVILLLVLISGLATDLLQTHALIGAFLLGVVMPKDSSFVMQLKGKLEDFVVVLLVPLYFAFTGLRTNLGLMTGPEALFYFGLILIFAVVGKFGGAFFASKLSGMPWREAASVGVIMNTRGMIELVALNIGLDIGVISPLLFTAMVSMSIITTFMTSPIVEILYPRSLYEA